MWPWSRPQPPSTPPHPAVVRVLAEEPDGIAQGSGTLVDAQGPYGLIVTNWHVVRDASGPINVVFPDGFRSAARVLQVDRDWDLAALLIWRPTAAAVPLAQRTPRPGDPLTIAGYGSGTYRAVTGRCTQYVAPSAHHPYEMVEVSAAARQGDSGGPIFNERGELAGVLFGSVSGTTSGSYAGRIRQFLASAWPPPDSAPQTVASASAAAEEGPSLHRLPEVDASAAHVAQLTPLPPLGRSGEPRTTSLDPTTPSPAASTDVSPVPSTTVQWSDLAGSTLYEQVKTVLAVIGLAAVFLRLTGAGQNRVRDD
ncbi:MAG: serine protease [Pirellulaceae bacterium]|nr:serine protease [Pirellulaceae bacterium]